MTKPRVLRRMASAFVKPVEFGERGKETSVLELGMSASPVEESSSRFTGDIIPFCQLISCWQLNNAAIGEKCALPSVNA
jgi:hypothetical protein